jgi:enoyl-CoA hydratase/carnithine racemase
VCTESARFYFAETRVGFAMASGTARLLPLMVGLANARKLALLGQTIDGREAYRIGLAVELAPEGEHEDVALGLADEALRGAPIAIAAQKRLLDDALEMSLEAVRAAEIQTSFRLAQTKDHQEAKRAFAAKRTPAFHGK